MRVKTNWTSCLHRNRIRHHSTKLKKTKTVKIYKTTRTTLIPVKLGWNVLQRCEQLLLSLWQPSDTKTPHNQIWVKEDETNIICLWSRRGHHNTELKRKGMQLNIIITLPLPHTHTTTATTKKIGYWVNMIFLEANVI